MGSLVSDSDLFILEGVVLRCKREVSHNALSYSQ